MFSWRRVLLAAPLPFLGVWLYSKRLEMRLLFVLLGGGDYLYYYWMEERPPFLWKFG
jgi:hypothetical protein